MLDFVLSLVVIAFCGFAIFLLVNHLFTFIFLFVEIKLNKSNAPNPASEISMYAFAKKCIQEFFYMIGKFYLFPYSLIDLTLKPSTSNNQCAILLIHGYLRNQSDWLWFRKQLLPLGYPIYTLNLKPSLAAIQVITFNSINEKIAQIQQQTNCKEIILIGHSMGGLIASYYSEYSDASNLIQRIVNIATPFSGTKLSVLAAGDNAKQMLPDAMFTTELREKIAKSDKKYFQVATQLDNIVFPWQSELLDTTPADRQYVLPTTTHLALLHSPDVTKQICAWLQD